MFAESCKKILGFKITLCLLDVLAFGAFFSWQGTYFLLDKPFIGMFPYGKELIYFFCIPVTFKIFILNSVFAENIVILFVWLLFLSVMQKWTKKKVN